MLNVGLETCLLAMKMHAEYNIDWENFIVKIIHG